MYSERQYTRYSPNKAGSALWCVYALIAANVAFAFLADNPAIFQEMALSNFGIREMKLWQIFTAMFLHGGFWHLFINMWGLYLFGTIVAPELGVSRFLNLYFISGAAGNLLWLAFYWNTQAYIVGASGALFGVMMAVAMLYPDKEFLLLIPPVTLKTKTMVIVYALIEVFSQMMGGGAGVAHLAHLGGFAAGYIYIKILYKNNCWDILDIIKGKKGARSAPRGWSMKSYDYQGPSEKDDDGKSGEAKPVSQRELDRILDKISERGINSLSQEEYDTLKRAREQMKDRG
jgi:membrane associated rhomboid family serine protease